MGSSPHLKYNYTLCVNERHRSCVETGLEPQPQLLKLLCINTPCVEDLFGLVVGQLSVYKEGKWLIYFQLESVKCVSTQRIAPIGGTIVEPKFIFQLQLFSCQILAVSTEENTLSLRNQSSTLGPVLSPKVRFIKGCFGLQVLWTQTLMWTNPKYYSVAHTHLQY